MQPAKFIVGEANGKASMAPCSSSIHLPASRITRLPFRTRFRAWLRSSLQGIRNQFTHGRGARNTSLIAPCCKWLVQREKVDRDGAGHGGCRSECTKIFLQPTALSLSCNRACRLSSSTTSSRHRRYLGVSASGVHAKRRFFGEFSAQSRQNIGFLSASSRRSYPINVIPPPASSRRNIVATSALTQHIGDGSAPCLRSVGSLSARSRLPLAPRISVRNSREGVLGKGPTRGNCAARST